MVIISKYSNTIEYNLKTTLDASGLTKLQSELNGVSLKLQQMSNQELISDKSKADALKTVTTVQKALTKAFNPKMGMLDLSQFQKGLNGLGLPQIQRDFYKIGVEGKTAFASLLGSIGKIDVGLKSTSNNLDKIKNTISNTVRWGVVSSAFNQIGNSLRDSVQYMKDLDDSLTQIMLVTDYSRENMNDFAKGANEAAKALGSTTTAMTNASLVFAQQGFNLDQSQQLAELSTKLANASQQDTSATSDQITAYMNAYGLDQNMAALSEALDAWAQVANVSAADVAELAQASQKAASTANTVGVSMDQLNAQIATIESVTREAPEQIGNGLKTLYARFSDLEAGSTLEDGVSLGKVTEQLEKYGVEVLDGEGKMRGVGDIMEDLMEVWSSLDQTQKAAVAQTVAGKYQLSRFESLMNRSDLYEQYKSSSENAEGTLDEMNQKYVDSLEGKMKTLQATLEGVFSSLFDSDDFYGMIDALTELVDLMDNFVQSIGGGEQALLALGSIGLKTFSKDIGANIGKMVYNSKADKLQEEQIQGQRNSILQQMGLGDIDKAEIEETVNYIDKSLSKSSMMTEDHIKQNNSLLKEQTDLTKKKIEAQEALNKAHFGTNAAYSLLGVDDVIHKEKDGSLNASGLEEQEKAGTILSNSEIKDLDWDSISSNILKANSELKIMEDRVKTLSTTGTDKIVDTQAFYDDLNRLDSIFVDIKKETEGLTGPIADAKEEFDQLWLAAVEGGENFTTAEAQKYIEALKQKILSMIEAAKEAQKNGSNVVDAEELKRLEQAYKDLESQQEILNKKQSTFFKELDFSAAISNIGQLAAATGDLIFGFQTLSNIGTIWDNEELTSGEKLLQTILALSSAVPMLAMGFTDMYDSSSRLMKQLKDLAINLIDAENASRNLVETLTTQETIDTAATEANSAAKTEKAAASTAAATAETLETKATSENTEEKVENTITTETNTAAKVKGAEASVATATAETLVGNSAKAATPGILAMGKALLKAFWPFLAVGVVVGGIAAIFGALTAEYTKTERAAADAAKKSKEAAKAFDTAKNTYDSFSSNADAYREAKNALDDLEEGTKEWNDALDGVNQQVLDLLEKYPQLAEYITKGANGSLQISEEGFSVLDSQLKENLSNSQMNLAAAKENEAVKSLEHSATELSRTVKAVETRTRRQLDDNPNVKARKYVEREETREFPLTESEAQTILNEVKEKGSGILSDADQLATLLGKEATDPIIKAIQDNADKFIKAVNDAKNHKTAADIYAKEAAQAKLESLGYDANNEDNNAIVDLTSSYAQQHSKDNYDLYMSKSDEDIQRAYMENTGYSFDKKEGNTYQFKDAEGNAVPVTKEEMASLLSAADALDAAAAKLDSFAETAATLSVSDAAKTFDDTSMLTRTKEEGFNFSSLDNDDLNQIVGGKDTDAGGANRIIDTKNLGEYLGFDPTAFEEYAENLGYQSADAYTKAFKEEFQRRQAEIVETENLLTKGTKDGSEGIKVGAQDSLSDVGNSEQQQQYEQQAKEILQTVDSISELDKAFTNNRLLSSDYSKGLKNLSKNYQDLQGLSQNLTKAQQKQKKALKESGKGSEEYRKATKNLEKAQGELEDAIIVKEWEKAAKQCKKYTETLKTADKGSEDYDKALKGIAKELTKVSGIKVDSSWVEQNQDAIQEWQDGVEGSASKLRTLIGTAAQGFEEDAKAVGTTVQDMNAALNDLTFDVNGNADFSSILQQMDLLDEHNQLSEEKAKLLADILSSLGATDITFDQNGEMVKFDIQSLVSKLQDGDTEALAELQEALVAFKGGAEVSGHVPAAGIPRMAPAGTGAPSNNNKNKGASGGGGSKKYTPKENKGPIDNKVDRYQEVNAKLDSITADYEKLANEQDRLTGDELAENLAKQNELLQKQIALYETKLKIQQQEADELKGKLGSQFGIQFDAEGFMTNYASVHQSLIDEVNRLNNQYSSVTSEEAEKALDKQVEAAEKRLEMFEEMFSRYTDLTTSEMKETLQLIEDQKDAIEDLAIEAFKRSVGVLDNIKDINEALAKFNEPIEVWLDDDPFAKLKEHTEGLAGYFDDASVSATEYYDNLISKNQEYLNNAATDEGKAFYKNRIDKLQNAKLQAGKGTVEYGGTGYLDMSMTNVTDILEQIDQYEKNKTSSIFGENGAALYETAKEIFDQATATFEDFKDEVKELQDTLLEAMDKIFNLADKRMEKYNNITEKLDFYKDIIEMTQGDKAYDAMNEVLDAQVKNNNAQVNDLKAMIATYEDMLKDMREGSPEYEALVEKIKEAQSQLQDLTLDSISKIREQYENTVNKITESWGNKLVGGDLEWKKTQWELINQNADHYLDDVNKAYNLQKLQNKYLDMLDQTNDLNIQQQITAQMNEQLDTLKKKNKLSEYDVQYANAQLDILQKRIALEEAHKNKNQMKLRRDSQGNYSYAYAANDDNIRGAEDALLDAQNNAYNLSKDQMAQTQNDIFAAISNAQSLIQQVKTDMSLTQEEQKKRIEEIMNQTAEYIGGAYEQMTTSQQNILKDFVAMTEMTMEFSSDSTKKVLEEVVAGNEEAFKQIDARWGLLGVNFSDLVTNLENANTECMNGMIEAGKDYTDALDEVANNAGVNFDNISSHIKDTKKETEGLVESHKTFINVLKDMSGEVKNAEATLNHYRDKINELNNDLGAYKTKVNELAQQLADKERELQATNAELNSYKNPGGGSGGSSGGSGAGGAGGKDARSLAYGIANSIWVYGDWGTGETRKQNIIDRYGTEVFTIVQDELFNRNHYGYNGYNDRYGYVRFDTGGYTGSWADNTFDNKNGKLAVLHQKELVLNAQDTENILAAVKTVRAMADMFKAQSLNSFNNALNSFGISRMQTQAQDINQEVHITAEFPNAQSASEIENALLGLNDRSLQYAFKNI